MSKGLRMLKGARRIAAFASSMNQPGQRLGPDGRFLKAGAVPVAKVVTQTRQQRRYLARQAAKGGDLVSVAVEAWDDVTGGAGAPGQPRTATAGRALGTHGVWGVCPPWRRSMCLPALPRRVRGRCLSRMPLRALINRSTPENQ